METIKTPNILPVAVFEMLTVVKKNIERQMKIRGI